MWARVGTACREQPAEDWTQRNKGIYTSAKALGGHGGFPAYSEEQHRVPHEKHSSLRSPMTKWPSFGTAIFPGRPNPSIKQAGYDIYPATASSDLLPAVTRFLSSPRASPGHGFMDLIPAPVQLLPKLDVASSSPLQTHLVGFVKSKYHFNGYLHNIFFK